MLKNIALASSEEREHIYTSIDEELQKLVRVDTVESTDIQHTEPVNQDVLEDFMGQFNFGAS